MIRRSDPGSRWCRSRGREAPEERGRPRRPSSLSGSEGEGGSAVRPPDQSAWAIAGANAFAIVLAVWQGWALIHLLWPFWIQSVVIGWYWRQRILRLEGFCTEGVRINDRPVDATPETRRLTANFFALHFGGFHFVYLFFLLAFTLGSDPAGMVTVTSENTGVQSLVYVGKVAWSDVPFLIGLGISFWWTHRESFREHVAADLARTPNLGTLMLVPYFRVLPMHLTLIFGMFLGASAGVWLFGLLKTGADVAMHKAEHKWMQEGRGAVPIRASVALGGGVGKRRVEIGGRDPGGTTENGPPDPGPDSRP